jgi:hypothetical protein
MIYRGSGVLAVVLFCSSPHHLPACSSKLSLFLCLPVCHGRAYWWRGRGKGGGGAKSYVGEKVWSSINHSMLSVDKFFTVGDWSYYVKYVSFLYCWLLEAHTLNRIKNEVEWKTWCSHFRTDEIPEKNAEWQRQLLYDDPGLVVEELNLI